jgi:hypothetical protein
MTFSAPALKLAAVARRADAVVVSPRSVPLR